MPRAPCAEQVGRCVSLPVKIERCEKRRSEVRAVKLGVAARILDAGDGARVALVQPADDLRGDRHAADIGEVVEVEPEVRPADALDDGGEVAEGRVLGDAARG